MPVANGFINTAALMEHFYEHGADFDATDAQDYLRQAIEFLEEEIHEWSDTLECVRSNGEIIRFNPVTDEFGVVLPDGTIKTYFKPMPFHLRPEGWRIDQTHPFASNREYFEEECNR